MKALLLLLLLSLSLRAEVYEIAEPDLLEEIEVQAKLLDKEREKLREEFREMIESYTGEELVPAREDRKYTIDPTYCLPADIYYREGEEWKVLYPKGYCFNPVNHIPYTPPPMVVFNPCRKEEREYVLKNHPRAILVSTGCPLKEVRKKGVRVYFLTEELKEKLRLTETISIVRVDREKGLIEVEVLKVDGAGSKGGVSGKAEGVSP